jgi:hypothetical protein
MTACRASRSVATLAFSMAALGICAPSGSAQQPDSPSVQQSVPAAGQPEPVPAQQPPPAAQQQVQAPPPTPPPAPGKAGRGTPWAKFAGYKDFFPLLAGSATVLAILLTGRWAWAAALRASLLQRQLAQGSVLLSCNERYDRILEAFAKLQERQQAAIVTATTPPVTPEEALGFFRRYWGLQHDQFQYFREGLVDERTFRFWLSARYRDFHSPAPMEIGEITFPRAWEALRAATDLPDPGFFEVMDLAMDVRGTEADRENEAVERAVRHFRENVRA